MRARVFEFDKNLKYVKEWIPNAYGLSFAHGLRVDPKDNVWVVDEGSNMVIKVDPTGLVAMVLGRKPESIDWWEERVERGVHDPEGQRPKAQRGTYNRPTDVAWGPDGSIFVAGRLQQLPCREARAGRRLAEGVRELWQR